jgi:hypothetical protein
MFVFATDLVRILTASPLGESDDVAGGILVNKYLMGDIAINI